MVIFDRSRRVSGVLYVKIDRDELAEIQVEHSANVSNHTAAMYGEGVYMAFDILTAIRYAKGRGGEDDSGAVLVCDLRLPAKNLDRLVVKSTDVVAAKNAIAQGKCALIWDAKKPLNDSYKPFRAKGAPPEKYSSEDLFFRDLFDLSPDPLESSLQEGPKQNASGVVINADLLPFFVVPERLRANVKPLIAINLSKSGINCTRRDLIRRFRSRVMQKDVIQFQGYDSDKRNLAHTQTEIKAHVLNVFTRFLDLIDFLKEKIEQALTNEHYHAYQANWFVTLKHIA